MAFPTAGILDTFNRADGGLGTDWTTPLWPGDTTLEIVSNKCVRNATFAFANAYWDIATFGGSGIVDEVYATVAQVPASGAYSALWLGVIAPVTAGMDGYSLAVVGSSWQLYRIDNLGETAIGSGFTQALTIGDGIGLSRNGAGVLEIWYRSGSGGSWVSKGTVSDGTYQAAGYIGLAIQGINPATNAMQWDDFGGGNATAAGIAARQRILRQAVKRSSVF